MSTYGDGTPLDAADAYLAAADPVLAALIARYGPVDEGLHLDSGDLYGALILAICSQQLSTRSARAIYRRLLDRYGGRTPTADQFLADDPDAVRVAAGCRTPRRCRWCRWPGSSPTAGWISTNCRSWTTTR